MIGWLHGQEIGGFRLLLPLQFISVEQLRVAPALDTPACMPGLCAISPDGSQVGADRAPVSFPVHGPVLTGAEQ